MMVFPPVKERPARRAHRFRRWFRLFLILLVMTTVGVSVSVSALLVYIGKRPPITALENYAPPLITRVVDRTGQIEIARFKRENRVLARIDEIPDIMKKAVLATEDEHFYEHFGIYLPAIARAMLKNIKSGKMKQGFSTITMQLPRNFALTGREKKLDRKLIEIVYALQIEKRYSKDQILEFYLNQVLFGKGAYGIKAAAQAYFGRDLSDLTPAQCAYLAGLPQAPSYYDDNVASATQRRNFILVNMLKMNYIDREVFEKSAKEPVVIHPGQRESNLAPYFVSYLEYWLTREGGLKQSDLYNNGYFIRSTIDLDMQRIAEQELTSGLIQVERKWQDRKSMRRSEEPELGAPPKEEGVRLAEITKVSTDSVEVRLAGYRATIPLPVVADPNGNIIWLTKPWYRPEQILVKGALLDVRVTAVDRKRGRFEAELFDTIPIQGAAVVLDLKTGEVLALVGGTDFNNKDWKGEFNRACLAQRQTGSCFKPLVFALGLDSGLTPSSVFVDEEVWFGNYSPKNYEKMHYGATTLLTALEHSRNVITVLLYDYLLRKLGHGVMKQRIQNFDMVGAAAWNFQSTDLSTALGSMDMTPLEMAAAYLPFGNGGVGIGPRAATEVRDLEYNPITEYKRRERVIVSPVTAFNMVYLMRSVVLRGTGKPVYDYFARIKRKNPDRVIPQICGKTGTTNDCMNAWFVGYTPDLVVGVWVGFDTPRTLGPKMTGAYVASPIWSKIVDRVLLENKTWQTTFKQPAGMAYLDIESGGPSDEGGDIETGESGVTVAATPAAPGAGEEISPDTVTDVPSRRSTDPYKGFKD
jgi:penicillin-binding protein 1A